MKSVIDHFGAYNLNLQGITLSHFNPEDDINPYMAWMVESTPINFDHPENDPVDLAVGLDLVEDQKHVQDTTSPRKRNTDARGGIENARIAEQRRINSRYFGRMRGSI